LVALTDGLFANNNKSASLVLKNSIVLTVPLLKRVKRKSVMLQTTRTKFPHSTTHQPTFLAYVQDWELARWPQQQEVNQRALKNKYPERMEVAGNQDISLYSYRFF